MGFTDEEALRLLHQQMGKSDPESKDLLTSGGYDPSTVSNSPSTTIAQTEPMKADQSDTFDITVRSAGIKAWLATQSNIAVGESTALDAARVGLENVAKLDEGAYTIRESISRNVTTGFSRAGNLLELVAGATEPLWHRPQQALFGMLSGRSVDEVKSIILPEIWGGSSKEPTPFMAALDQLRDLHVASMSALTERFWQIADQEPTVLESMENDIEFQEVVIKQAFGGDAGAFGSWLAESMNTSGLAQGNLLMMMTGAMIAGEVLVDPLMLFDFAPALVAKGSKLSGKALKNSGDLGDLVKLQKAATKKLDTAKAIMDKTPGDFEAMRGYVQAEKRMVEANMALDMRKQDVTDIFPDGTDSVRKMPKRNPETIKTRGNTVEDVRRQVLANEIMPREEVMKALSDNGFSGLSRTQLQLQNAVEEIRGGVDIEAAIDVLNRFSRLPENAKKHLDMIGVGRELVVRREALRAKPMLTDDFTKFDGPLFSQRAALGPDDAEVAGDAMKKLVEGAHPGDVTTYGAIAPEYQMLGHGDPMPRFVDGRFNRWMENPNKVNIIDPESGMIKSVFRDWDQINMFGNRAHPGMTPGSVMLDPREVMKNALWAFREPMHALRGTGIFERWSAGGGDYLTQTQATTEWLTDLASKSGLGGTNRWGQFRWNKAGKVSKGKIFDVLNKDQLIDGVEVAMDTEKFAKAMDDLTPQEKDVYFGMRQWLDHMADRQGIQGDMRLADYAPHYFSKDQFRGGARPIEYLGLPASSEVTAGHLLKRTGRKGYNRDPFTIMENYNRAAHRKIIMQPTYDDMLDMARASGREAVVAYTNDFVREAKGIPTPMDQQVDRILQTTAERLKDVPLLGIGARKLAESGAVRAALTVSGLFYSSLLSGNPNYLTQNLGTGALNPLARFGMLNTARGAMLMLSPEGRKLAMKSGIDKQWVRIYENEGMNKLNDFMSRMGPAQSEFYNRGLSFHAALSDITNKAGMSVSELREAGLLPAALADAVRAAEYTQFVYGVGGRSPMLSRMLGKSIMTTGTQFLSFPFKQTEFLFAIGQENPGYVMRYFAYSGIMQRLAAEIDIDSSQFTGIGPQLDFLQPKRGRPMPLSPGMEVLASMADLSDAAGKEDLTAMEYAVDKILKGLEGAMPGVKILERTGKMARELSTGEVRNPASGEFIRPKVFPEELIPTILQTRSREDRLQAQFDRQFLQKRNDKIRKQRMMLKEAMKALESGDTTNLDALQTQLAKEGIFLSDQAVDKQYELRTMSRRLRVLLHNPEFMPTNMFDSPLPEGSFSDQGMEGK